MNDVERDAQDEGYNDGTQGRKSTKFDKYPNLAAAYNRGWQFGNQKRQESFRE